MWRIVREGTHDALERLKSAGFKLGIVSNADGRVAGDAKRLGLAQFFDVIIDSQVVGVEKPNPKIFQLALDALGVPPEEAMYAGDIYAIDMLGARAAGIHGKLIDQHGMYHWIEHPKIRHVGELHILRRATSGCEGTARPMGSIRETADKLFAGELPIREHHPLSFTGESEEVADGVMFCRWFANVSAIKTAEGLVLVDTGAYFNQRKTLEAIRRYSRDRVNAAIYTHGHVDHACGMPAIVEEAGQEPRRAPARRWASRGRRALRSLQAHRRLQQRRQCPPIQSALDMADRVCLSRHLLRSSAECRGGPA